MRWRTVAARAGSRSAVARSLPRAANARPASEICTLSERSLDDGVGTTGLTAARSGASAGCVECAASGLRGAGVLRIDLHCVPSATEYRAVKRKLEGCGGFLREAGAFCDGREGTVDGGDVSGESSARAGEHPSVPPLLFYELIRSTIALMSLSCHEDVPTGHDLRCVQHSVARSQCTHTTQQDAERAHRHS